jgi:hypothetical protein
MTAFVYKSTMIAGISPRSEVFNGYFWTFCDGTRDHP